MARHWLRQNSDNTLTGRVTDNDDLATNPPTGHTWIAEADIRAVYATGDITAGGVWNGTVYTPRAFAAATTRDNRRRQIMIGILRWATTPGFAAVQAKEAARATGWRAICEALTRACLVDANLDTQAQFDILVAELAKDPERAIWKFDLAAWRTGGSAYYPETGTWNFHTLNDLYANDNGNNVTGTAEASVTLADAPADWLEEVQKFAT